jgi:hypothetical protein
MLGGAARHLPILTLRSKPRDLVARVGEIELRAPGHPNSRLLGLRIELPRQEKFRQAVPLDHLLHLELEAPVAAFRARLFEQRFYGDGEAQAVGAAGVLSGDAVEPTLAAARDFEIPRIDGEDTPWPY